jgi:hypothetical protein
MPMLVPEFWAEGTVRVPLGEQQVTVQRFGWSDVSQVEAQGLADERARVAARRMQLGETLEPRELRRAYNGAEGVPIREELVSRHGETIITRNAYGALCLNTPRVLFVDIDNALSPGIGTVLVSLAISLGVAAAVIWWQWRMSVIVVALIVAVGATYPLAMLLVKVFLWPRGGERGVAIGLVRKFVEWHPEWHVRVYATPAGLRVLAMHQTFDPNSPEVAECFQAMWADALYVLMCQRQQCFRARVSPKPWRIGVRRFPSRAVWPVDSRRLAERQKWAAEYDDAARGFASCTYLESLGSARVDAEAAEVQKLHDELCRATSRLPMG